MTESAPSPKSGKRLPAEVSRRRMTPGRRLLYAVTAPILVSLVRTMWWSFRFEIRGDESARKLAVEGQPMVLAFWHHDLFMMPWYLSALTKLGVGVTYLVSPSIDGDYAVKLLEVIGARAVRGSATRSGTRAIRGLYRVIVKDKGSPVVAVDGPRGPRHRCKKGAVSLAQLTGAKIVPLAAIPRQGAHLRSWDRLTIPFPFTRVALEVGEPITVPKEATPDEVEAYRQQLEERIIDLGERAAERVGRSGGER